MQSANLDTFLKEEFIEMTLDHEAKLKYTFKRTGYYRMNGETIAKYPKLREIIETILLAFLGSYMVQSWFKRVHYLQNLWSIFNLERGNLMLKLKNLQSNICDLRSIHQIHLSHWKIT